MFKKIMIASDGSETSMRAAELAVELARLSEGSITVIYVVDIYRLASLPEYTSFPSISGRLMELMLKESEQATAEVGEMAWDAGVPFRRIVAEGEPSDEILRGAYESGSDLLVVGRIGRSGLEKIMLGSVAEKVVRHSKVPVLIVPALSRWQNRLQN